MAQSWWRSLLEALPGYLFTVAAAIPASVVGWLLLGNGFTRQSALVISIVGTVSLGFILEGAIKKFRPTRHKQTPMIVFKISIHYLAAPISRPEFKTPIKDDRKYAPTIVLLAPPTPASISEFHLTV